MADKKLMMLEDEKLEELAKDPRNLVYKFKEREPLPANEVVPLPEVASKIRRMYAAYCALRQEHITAKRIITKKRWAQMKTTLLQDEEWKRFDHTHPLIFDRIVHPETTDKEITALLYMIHLKERETSGQLPDAPEIFRDFIVEQFAISREQYEKEKKEQGYA